MLLPGLWLWLLLTAYTLLEGARAAALPPLQAAVDIDVAAPAADEEPGRTWRTRSAANNVFNAIHSSMRQWGSSLNHNGMSLFLAQVPAGVQFYHGTGHPEPVEGMEWLAFEPEHAINFARRFERRTGKGKGDRGKRMEGEKMGDRSQTHHAEARSPSDPTDGQDHANSPSNPTGRQSQRMLGPLSPQDESQNPMTTTVDHRRPPKGRPGPGVPGWLHTYRTKTPLPLLYIDGMSAGKTDKGTLDTQDTLLLNAKNESNGLFWEGERAERLCQMASETWNGKIKGFIRMEAGFEVILCSFAENLDFIQAVRAGSFAAAGDHDHDHDSDDDEDKSPRWQLSDWIRAITARYDGIGGGRVKLNYDHFVTAFNYDIDLFTRGDGLPRLEDASDAVLNQMRRDVDATVDSWDPSLEVDSRVDWQAVADMVVERYARQLKYLVSGAFTTSHELSDHLRPVLRVFLDSDARNTTAEVARCASQFIPGNNTRSPSSAAAAVRSVTTEICSTLFAVLDPKEESFAHSMARLHSLIEYLDWTVWKRCPECPLDQICFIPIWPFGAVGDRENPQCRNATEINGRSGYWGHFGGPGQPPPHDDYGHEGGGHLAG